MRREWIYWADAKFTKLYRLDARIDNVYGQLFLKTSPIGQLAMFTTIPFKGYFYLPADDMAQSHQPSRNIRNLSKTALETPASVTK